jgi:hypothetical protein
MPVETSGWAELVTNFNSSQQTTDNPFHILGDWLLQQGKILRKFILWNAQVSSGAHQASYSMDTGEHVTL